jgi:hypothetical protein
MARRWHGRRERRRSHLAATALQYGTRVRPVLGDHRLAAKSPEGSRQLGGETRIPRCPPSPFEVRGCRLSDLQVQRTSGDRSCPLLSVVCRPLRTQHGPRVRDGVGLDSPLPSGGSGLPSPLDVFPLPTGWRQMRATLCESQPRMGWLGSGQGPATSRFVRICSMTTSGTQRHTTA